MTITTGINNTTLFHFNDVFEMEEVQRLLDLFSLATEVSPVLTNPDGSFITTPGNFCGLCRNIVSENENGLNCIMDFASALKKDQSSPEIHICENSGYMVAGERIVVDGKHIANWIIGRKPEDEKPVVLNKDNIVVTCKTGWTIAPTLTTGNFHIVVKNLSIYAKELSKNGLKKLELREQITERELVIGLLHESEKKYHAIIENVEEVFFHSDLEGTNMDFSLSVSYLKAFERDEFTGSSVFNLFYNQGDRIDLIERLKKDGQVRDYEVRLKTKENEIRYVSINACLALDESGCPNFMDGAIRDITDRKRAEKELLECQIKFEELVNHSPDAFVIYQDGVIVFVNDETLLLSGATSKQELVGKKVMDFVHADYHALVNERMKRITSQKMALPIIHEKLLRLDGSEIDVEVIAMPITFDGEFAVQLIIHNITKRKKSEKELRILEKAILTTGEAIYLTDKEGVFIFVNPAFTKLYGFEAEEVVDKATPRILKNGFSDGSFYERFWATLLKGEEVRGEIVNKRKDGILIDIDSSVTPIVDNENTIIGFLGIQRDISERKLQEQELILAKDKAEENNRLKTTFLNNISHEIRTPFNGILGFLSIVLEDDLSKAERDNYVDIIYSSSFRLMETINNLVEISEIQSGQIELTQSDITIKEMSYELYKSFKTRVESKGLEFSISFDLKNEEEVICTDHVKLKTVLSSLLTNAIKFTDLGYIEFRISKNYNYLLFTVKDTGVGIPENKISTIFELFIQADGENDRFYEGLGLGLCITKAYVDMLGGKIWVESKMGKGSTFYVEIPLENPGDTIKVFQPKTLQNIAEDHRFEDLRIMIVEDEINSLNLIEHYVKAISNKILIARNGAEAVEMFHQNPDIDLILMDIRMPVMDGYEATRHIRKFDPRVVIIAQTAFVNLIDQKKAHAAGFNDYITKPLFSKNLKKLLEKYF